MPIILSKLVFAIVLVSVSFSAHSVTIRVSQETSAGAGDFDANILGQITTYATTETSAAFYNYGASSYNGQVNGGPNAIPDTTINFFVITSDGLTFYNVHDHRNDGDGGQADMSWSLAGGDTAAFMVSDENNEGLNPLMNIQDTSFTTNHAWLDCCTDGFGLGTLDGGGWTLYGEFDFLDTLDPRSGDGILAWNALSADGGVIPLALELDRRVRFDLTAIPVPAAVWLFGTALIGLVGLSKRRRAA